MNRIGAIKAEGQSIWYDYIQRSMIWTGALHRMVQEDDLGGVTSNPAIFEKAIGGSNDYEGALRAAIGTGQGAGEIFEEIAITDIQLAADTLRPAYDRSKGVDGYVSLEVSPHLAYDTDATIADALRLWHRVSRDNLMIKVPATEQGLAAVEELIAEGVNVNVTLLFAVDMYERVAGRFQAGLERRLARGLSIDRVHSVASFFVSRIDSLVDKWINERIQKKPGPGTAKSLAELKGKVAVANAKVAYRSFEKMIESTRWKKLRGKGASPQRLLWASTSTKNADYRDVLYVEELIGPETVNTVPEKTYDAFHDHGEVGRTLTREVAEAEALLERLSKLDINLEKATDQLLVEGVRKFADAFDKLLATVERRRRELLGTKLSRMAMSQIPTERLEALRTAGFTRRLWERDATLFGSANPKDPAVSGYMGWLDATARIEDQLDDLEDFGRELKREGLDVVVLMGMGGSSLAPEVLGKTFERKPGHPELLVLDSTVPAQVQEIEGRVEGKRALFVVASKSGTTTEPLSFLARFWGKNPTGQQFVAITDPGSKLETLARERGFRHIFYGEPEIGGRYSVISCFGMVAAAAMGLDVRDLIARARRMEKSSGPLVPPAENAGVSLGAFLGTHALAGRDKLTIVSEPELSAFGGWLEQLVAESTGKDNVGIIPVDREPFGAPEAYGTDRVFYFLRLEGKERPELDQRAEMLEKNGHPVVVCRLADRADLVQEMVRWEVATATAGHLLGINPFNQPNVQESKEFTRQFLEAFKKNGNLPPVEGEAKLLEESSVVAFADPSNAKALSSHTRSLQDLLGSHFSRAEPGDYIAINAYLPMTDELDRELSELRGHLRKRFKVATTHGFGPRFLHSTGQLHKGGPNRGVFLLITQEDPADVPIPGQPYGFSTLKKAQSNGDMMALSKRDRRLVRLHFSDLKKGLSALRSAL